MNTCFAKICKQALELLPTAPTLCSMGAENARQFSVAEPVASCVAAETLERFSSLPLFFVSGRFATFLYPPPVPPPGVLFFLHRRLGVDEALALHQLVHQACQVGVFTAPQHFRKAKFQPTQGAAHGNVRQAQVDTAAKGLIAQTL